MTSGSTVTRSVDAAMTFDAAKAWAAITLMSLPDISCQALANGSMHDMPAVKIFASYLIMANTMCDVLFMAFITPAWA
jgi:hypothetical protein